MSVFTIVSTDNIKISVHKWVPAGEIKGILLIAHGMAEHGLRYSDFARYMNQAGFAVAAPDHRGCGLTAGDQDHLGYFSIENGWNKVVDDLGAVKDILQNEYSGIPLFVLGHSMGSFLVRDLIAKNGSGIKAVILSGTGYVSKSMAALMKLISSREIKSRGDRYRSRKLNKLTFENYNKNFRPNRTRADWLSRDPLEVDNYLSDPYCGYVSTCGFYQDFSRGLSKIADKSYIGGTPKDISMLIYSGSEDPLGKRLKSVADMYRKLGLNQVDLKWNPQGRHESLHETNRLEVFEIFRNFFLSLL